MEAKAGSSRKVAADEEEQEEREGERRGERGNRNRGNNSNEAQWPTTHPEAMKASMRNELA